MADIPLGLEALRLLARHAAAGPGGVIYLGGEQRIEGLAAFIAAAAPEVEPIVLPPWDCLPYDTASPSREAMGRRMAALRRMTEKRGAPPLVLTTAEAALQRVPPRSAVACYRLRAGEGFDAEGFRDFCARAGYILDERVDEAGEVAFRGEVVDIYPAACRWPYRLEVGDGRLATIRCYDPATQRSIEEAAELAVDAASELPAGEEEAQPGAEHWLPVAYAELETIFSYLPDARVVEAPGTGEARSRWLDTIGEAHRDRTRTGPAEEGAAREPLPPDRLYLAGEEWERAAAGAETLDAGDVESVPAFATARRPTSSLRGFLDEQRGEGRRAILISPTEEVAARLERRLRLPEGEAAAPLGSIREAGEAPAGALLRLVAPLDRGFVDCAAGIAVVVAADLLGSRGLGNDRNGGSAALWQVEASEFHLGDIAVHLEHGTGALAGLEALPDDAAGGEAVRLHYAEDQVLLLPAGEAGRLWRYGTAESDVSLDRLNSDVWPKRRAKILGGIAETARGLVAAAEERARQKAAKLAPPAEPHRRFAARFPYPLTPDQGEAVEAVLADLKAGRPMNRLVVGDVGFGKTEVALRAAAAAALAGAQVAVVAPTTVLARQHYETFRRRFEGFGITVGHLSRLVPAKEARRVKEGLAAGEIGVVVATHALLGKGVDFADLGLLVIDEEQRFGAQHKRSLRDLREGVHSLTLTATPIPRTLQSALVGLQDLSAINTPPLRRRPIRTLVAEFSPASLRQALIREKRRGGQSFVVVPRVEDVGPTAEMLRELLPRLDLRVAHGQLPVREVDEAMVGFAGGRGDILLATSIIESGLDVPRANTMIILRPDLFGLAQLHQLRGRVGRGHLQAYCYLMNEAGRELSEEATRRLGSLQAFDRLGAGMAISLHDLDLRGAGDLFGERQAGHLRLIGLSLYQDLLAGAVRAAKGEPEEADEIVLQAEAEGAIPADYVPEAIVRINLYHRLARARRPQDAEALADEIADRFGPPPEPVEVLLTASGIRALARTLGIVRVSAGPNGVAFDFRPELDVPGEFADALKARGRALEWTGERLVCRKPLRGGPEQREAILDLLRLLS